MRAHAHLIDNFSGLKEFYCKVARMMAADSTLSRSLTTVTSKLAISVRHTNEYTRTISRLGESLNTVITQLNQKADDETRQLRRDTRKSKEKYYKMLQSSAVFVNRFNKLLRFAELDESTKSKLVDSVLKGKYSDFTDYVNQLGHYLDQCYKLYDGFASTYMDAESHVQGMIATFEPNRRGFANVEGEMSPRRMNTVNLWPAIIGSLVGGIGVFIVGKLLNFNIYEVVGMSMFAAALCAFASNRMYVAFYNKVIAARDASLRLQYIQGSFQAVVQDYESVRKAGEKASASQHELQDSLMFLASDTCLKGQINPDSFGSEFDSLLGEVKKARGSIQQCYDKLNEGISISEISTF